MILLDLVTLDIDPNVVKPGWTPLLITIGLAVVMAMLFVSMRRQFRRVHANYDQGEDSPEVGGTGQADEVEPPQVSPAPKP